MKMTELPFLMLPKNLKNFSRGYFLLSCIDHFINEQQKFYSLPKRYNKIQTNVLLPAGSQKNSLYVPLIMYAII